MEQETAQGRHLLSIARKASGEVYSEAGMATKGCLGTRRWWERQKDLKVFSGEARAGLEDRWG